MELSPEQYEILFEKSKSLGLDFGFSAWDIESLNDLDHIEVDFQKIASAMSTNLEFLAEVSRKDKWIIASTGMTTWEEVDNLVSGQRGAKEGFTLLHTVSTYPAKESDLNLKMINTLQTRYNCEVGYSGHESSVSPSIFACALGAKVIERHFTLNRADWGTDHSASLEPAGMRRLVGSVKKWSLVLGDGEKREIEGEAEIAAKLRYWI
jgi:N-acetylneuraminate synthase